MVGAAERTKIDVNPRTPRTNIATRALLVSATSLTLVLALAGCTSADNPTPATGAGSETSAASSAASSDVPTPTPSVAGELAYLEEPQLAQAMGEWAKSQPGSKLTNDAALRAQIPAAEKWLGKITVVPSECGLYGGGGLKDQLAASVMTAVSLDEKTGGDVTVASYPDLNELVADVAAQQHLDSSCSKYTVTSEGQSITATMEALKVDPVAPYVTGTLMKTQNEGKLSQQVSIRAIDGHIMVTATRRAAKDPVAAVREATADANAVLELLRHREAQASG